MEKRDLDRINSLLKNPDSRLFRIIMFGVIRQDNGKKTYHPGIRELAIKQKWVSGGKVIN